MNNAADAPFEIFASPPYCPNPECAWHTVEACSKQGRFSRYGSRKVGRFPYVTKKYECRNCGKIFSDSIFYPFYRDRTEPTYSRIFHSHVQGQSRRNLAEELGCSLDTVQRRFRKLARQGLLIHASKAKDLRVRESVAYDGIENFAASQYDPNNINHIVGRESYFLYDFNFAPLNRKGRMSPRQRLRNEEIEKTLGRYPGNAIRAATRRILLRLLSRTEGDLVFHSDNHYAYREAIRSLPKGTSLEHIITQARAARNFRNKLFAINHVDLLTRQQLTTFKRETISFAKHAVGMIESFTLLMVWKNFMRTIFKKKHRRDPRKNKESPAMRLGIASSVLKFREFYRLCLMPTQVALNEDWAAFVERRDPCPRRLQDTNH